MFGNQTEDVPQFYLHGDGSHIAHARESFHYSLISPDHSLKVSYC